MRTRMVVAVAVCLVTGVFADPPNKHFEVKPDEFDPAHTHLVQAAWLEGIGCPTNAKIFTGDPNNTTFTDTACVTGDPDDNKVLGLLLAKTGPTGNIASAFARIDGVKGQTLTELGWDIRKPVSSFDPRGSHCGNGAPRWNVSARDPDTGEEGFFFIGCNSPQATTQTPGTGYVRMRWGGVVGGVPAPVVAAPSSATTPCRPVAPGCDITGFEIRSLSIVFDEGYDTGPDNFGMAVLDNIDVNGVLVGRGPTDAD
jgi:hypothetical protein